MGQRREDRQRLLSGMAFTIWHKWKRRCSAVNNRVKPSPFDTIRRLELAARQIRFDLERGRMSYQYSGRNKWRDKQILTVMLLGVRLMTKLGLV